VGHPYESWHYGFSVLATSSGIDRSLRKAFPPCMEILRPGLALDRDLLGKIGERKTEKSMENVMGVAAIDLNRAQPEAKQTAWEELERQDWHLWIFAILLFFILGVSLLSFMFPAVFWFQGNTVLETPKRAFFGFSVLLALVLVYMLQRQATVRRLKRQLFEAQTAVVAAKRDAFVQSFLALPGKDQFRDALAMEYRRASTSESHLAAGIFITHHASSEALGRMAFLLRSMLRRGESLYRIPESALGVIFPEMRLSDVAALAARVEELSGISKDELEVHISAYPDEAASLTELEWPLRSALAK
jgi:GGDEF domain-containing protein